MDISAHAVWSRNITKEGAMEASLSVVSRRRILVLFTMLIALVGAITGPASPAVAAGSAKPLPPQSKAYGKSLSEWMKLHAFWLLGGSQNEYVGKVRLMPLGEISPDNCVGEWTVASPAVCTGALTVDLKPGTPFVLPVLGWFGERYADGSEDVPLDPKIFTKSNAYVTLNGKALIDSRVDNLKRYYVAPIAFDTPIVYDQTHSNNAVAALWIQGLAFVHKPLAVGKHTLRIQSELFVPEYNLGVKFDTTWTITVRR
jgi:hypothetical protein